MWSLSFRFAEQPSSFAGCDPMLIPSRQDHGLDGPAGARLIRLNYLKDQRNPPTIWGRVFCDRSWGNPPHCRADDLLNWSLSREESLKTVNSPGFPTRGHFVQIQFYSEGAATGFHIPGSCSFQLRSLVLRSVPDLLFSDCCLVRLRPVPEITIYGRTIVIRSSATQLLLTNDCLLT